MFTSGFTRCILLIVLMSVSKVYLSSYTNYSFIVGPKRPERPQSRRDVLKLTHPSEHPYAVMVLCMPDRDIYKADICSGSILTKKWVLTAGHCILRTNYETGERMLYKQFVLYVGGSKYGELLRDKMPPGSQAPWADLAISHPAKDIRYNDIGIVRVAGPGFYFNDVVKMIKISVVPYTETQYYKCNVTAFGVVELNQAHRWDGRRKTQEVQILNGEHQCPCNDILYTWLKYKDPRKMLICARPRQYYGICEGDSGAGLICEGKLVGIASFFFYFNYEACTNMSDDKKCATKNSMAFFFDTCQFFSWIIPQVDPRPDFYRYIPPTHPCWNKEVAYE